MRQAKYRWCLLKKGGRCQQCQKDLLNAPWEAEFHHRPGVKKEAMISQLVQRDSVKLLKELEKCDLICSACHNKIHFDVKRWQESLFLLDHIISTKLDAISIDDKEHFIDDNYLISLTKKGLNIKEIAAIMSRSDRTIMTALRRLEAERGERLYPFRKERDSRAKLSDDELVKKLQSGAKQKQIALDYGLPLQTVVTRVWRLRQTGVDI